MWPPVSKATVRYTLVGYSRVYGFVYCNAWLSPRSRGKPTSQGVLATSGAVRHHHHYWPASAWVLCIYKDKPSRQILVDACSAVATFVVMWRRTPAHHRPRARTPTHRHIAAHHFNKNENSCAEHFPAQSFVCHFNVRCCIVVIALPFDRNNIFLALDLFFATPLSVFYDLAVVFFLPSSFHLGFIFWCNKNNRDTSGSMCEQTNGKRINRQKEPNSHSACVFLIKFQARNHLNEASKNRCHRSVKSARQLNIQSDSFRLMHAGIIGRIAE